MKGPAMTLRTMIVTMLLVTSLAGCTRITESRLNPFNWFGSDKSETAAPTVVQVQDRRPLVAEITQLVVERTPGGAIIRVTGLPPHQGWFAPELVRETPEGAPANGVLAYSLRAVPPRETVRVSTVQSRELTVAVYLTNLELAQVRVIRVTGARNARSVRR